jgi:hypothetical protein
LHDDKGDLLLGAGRGVDVQRPKFRQQQLPAAEDIKRQIAVAFVIALEEPAFLIAVDGVVGRVEIKDSFGGVGWLLRNTLTNSLFIAPSSTLSLR